MTGRRIKVNFSSKVSDAMPKRSKRLAAKAKRAKAKVRSAKKQAKLRKMRAGRASIGESMGVTPAKEREANLIEDRAMSSALAAARRLNEANRAGAAYAPSRRSSIALQRETERIFGDDDEDAESSHDAPPILHDSGSDNEGKAHDGAEPVHEHWYEGTIWNLNS